jgi:hypothetical protein
MFPLGSIRLGVMTTSKIFLLSVMGIFEYILVMSTEANVEVEDIGVRSNSWMSSEVFFILNEYGNGVNCLICCVSRLDNL